MPNYQNGKIYMIYPKVDNAEEGDVYYGSTTETISRRMTKHRSNNISSKILFDKYGVENCVIELVETYPCQSKEELNKKEGEYIRSNKCINKRIAGRKKKEYRIENHAKIMEYQKEYRVHNRDKLSEYHKEHYIENRDKLLEQMKEYHIENRDKILEYQKEYRVHNRDKLLEQKKKYYVDNRDKIAEKANCPHCNKLMSKGSINRHIKNIHN